MITRSRNGAVGGAPRWLAAAIFAACLAAADTSAATAGADEKRELLAAAAALRAQGVLKPTSLVRKLRIFPSRPDAAGILSAAMTDLFASSLVRVGDGRIALYSPTYAMGVIGEGDQRDRRYALFFLGSYEADWRAPDAVGNADAFAQIVLADIPMEPPENLVASASLVGRYILWLERLAANADVALAADGTIRKAFRLPKTARLRQIVAAAEGVEFYFAPLQSGDKYLRVTTDPRGERILDAHGITLLRKN